MNTPVSQLGFPDPRDPSPAEFLRGYFSSVQPEVIDQDQLPEIRHAESDVYQATYEDPNGLPSWRETYSQPVREPTELDSYAAEREAAGIHDVTPIHGFSPANPRKNVSPWRTV